MRLDEMDIQIETKEYGSMRLLPLLVGDMEWLAGEETQGLPAQEVATQLAHRILVNPRLDLTEIQSWPPELLLQVVTTWLQAQQDEAEDVRPAEESFETWRERLDAWIQEQTLRAVEAVLSTRPILEETFHHLLENIQPVVQNILDQINQLIAPAIEQMTQDVQDLMASAFQGVKVGQLFPALPDLAELEALLREAEAAGNTLKQGGYGVVLHLVAGSFLTKLARVSPQTRIAVATNQLLRQTRSRVFAERLEEVFRHSKILSRRWPVVARALAAHRERDYLLSIPVLLAQIEGMLGDALLLKRTLLRVGHKLYVRGPDGKPQLDKKGKRIECRGMDSLLQRSDYRSDPVLVEVANLLTTALVRERNAIAHGRKTAYGSPKVSLQGLLLLWTIARELAAFERQATP